jgi:hypothetical protein
MRSRRHFGRPRPAPARGAADRLIQRRVVAVRKSRETAASVLTAPSAQKQNRRRRILDHAAACLAEKGSGNDAVFGIHIYIFVSVIWRMWGSR